MTQHFSLHCIPFSCLPRKHNSERYSESEFGKYAGWVNIKSGLILSTQHNNNCNREKAAPQSGTSRFFPTLCKYLMNSCLLWEEKATKLVDGEMGICFMFMDIYSVGIWVKWLQNQPQFNYEEWMEWKGRNRNSSTLLPSLQILGMWETRTNYGGILDLLLDKTGWSWGRGRSGIKYTLSKDGTKIWSV